MDAEIMQKIVTAISEHKELWDCITRLDAGTGTYNDVDSIAELIGDQIADCLATEYSGELLEAYTEVGHELISMMGAQAQQNLNDAARIGIKPMTTKYPRARVKSLAEEIALVDEEMVPDEIKNAVPSLMLEMVDAIVKYNADFQAKAGLRPVIVRTWSGSYPSHDTKRTDWCHDLAGTYNYGDEPGRVYARHKGCRCKVEYYPSKDAKGRITALERGEVDRSGVLWNTKAETLDARIRAMARRTARENEK